MHKHSLDQAFAGEHGLLHECEDGHHWTQQPDGGVSPSWGMGLTSVKYDGWDPERCPEPERGHSRYENGGPDHGYKCPSCGTVHYVGGCLMGVRSDPWNTSEPECEPPPPACGKPPARTFEWRDRPRTRKGDPEPDSWGWVEIGRFEADGQMAIA